MTTAAQDFVDDLLEQEVGGSSEPPRRLSVGLAASASGESRVLVIGGELPRGTTNKLLSRGFTIDVALDLAAAVDRMSSESYDVVATWPHVEGDADGLRFVRAFKQRRLTQAADTGYALLLTSYGEVPFIVLPLTGSTEFAVFATHKRWCLEDTGIVPLDLAIAKARSLC